MDGLVSMRLRVTRTRNYLSEGTDHIEVESLAPKRAPLPITETGYHSHSIDAVELREAGGAKSFVEAWLARESRSKDWQKQDLARGQGDHFQWAETEAQLGRRRRQRPGRPKSAALSAKPEDKTAD